MTGVQTCALPIYPNIDVQIQQDVEFLKIKSHAIKSLSKAFYRLQFNDLSDVKNLISNVTDIVDYLLKNKDINTIHLIELKTYDNYTFVHSLNTCVLALFLGTQLGYSKAMLIDLGFAGLLHDIGKMKIPNDILNKKGKLTPEEFEVMKQHPLLGYDIIKNIENVNINGKIAVREHHEKVDGTGYPYGIKGNNISNYGKIICLSDVYDALTCDRSYRKSFPPSEAYEYILANSGIYFDFEFVNIFRNTFSFYPIGIEVKLSNGYNAFVIGQNKGFPDRPIIKVFRDPEDKLIQPFVMNLMDKTDITIMNTVF